MIFEYRVNIKNQIANGWSILALLIALCALGYYQVYIKHEDFQFNITIDAVIFLSQLIPLAIIHTNYYKINKGDIIIYDSDTGDICFKNSGGKVWFNISDIQSITRFVSFTYYMPGPSLLAWDLYNHSIIKLNDGKEFTVTSLLIFDLKLPVPKEKIIIEKDIFRLAHTSDSE